MDKADFSGWKASRQREDFPVDGAFSQTKLHAHHHFSSENNILGVSGQAILTAEDPPERTAHGGTCRKAGAVWTLGKMTERAAKENSDEEQCCPPTLHIPVKKGDHSKEALFDIIQRHLSKEELLNSQGSPWETPPEVSKSDSFDEAIVKSIILRYVNSFWPKEPTPEFTDELDSQKEDDTGSEPSCCPTTTAGNTAEREEPVTAGDGSLAQNSTFLTKSQGPSNKQEGCQEQKLQMENTRSGPVFKYGQVCYRFSDRYSVAPPQVKIPKNNMIDKPLPTDRQASFSPELRAGLALGQEIPEGTARPDRAEKEEQERKTEDPSQQTEVQPATHSHQKQLTGTESETRLWKLSPASQKDPSSTSSIFLKISQGREMCQRLREQTDQLKTKVQEFSRSLAQYSPGHEKDERLELEKLQAHLELLKQEIGAEEQLALEQQVRQPKPPAVSDSDPKRKAEGEVSRLETLLGDVEGKADEGKHTSAGSLPQSSPTLPGDLPSASSPPSDEDPSHASASSSGRQQRAETTGWSCALYHPALEWKQNLEKKGHRGTRCGGLPTARQEKAPHPDALLSPDTGLSGSSAPGAGLQSNPCLTCGTRTPSCPRGGRKQPLTEFHYRYNTPGRNYSNNSEGRASVQLRFLNERENSPPSYSKPNWICSQRANSKSSQDEREPTPGKKNLKAPMTSTSDLATSSPHFHSGRVSGSNSLSEETKSEVRTQKNILESLQLDLTASLDHALRTATILKETTDQMIRTIAEDLAKLQRWRNRVKY